MKIRINRIEAAKWFYRSIHTGFFFYLESSKQTIPNDEYSAMVSIDVNRIDGMVDSVVRGSRKQKLPHFSNLIYGFCVHPKLIDQVDLSASQIHPRVKSNERQGNIKNPSEKSAEASLSKGNNKIVFLAVVMDDMTGPEKIDFMRQSMAPVVTKILANNAKNPSPWIV